MGCFKADKAKTEFKLPGYLEGAQKDIASRTQAALRTPFKAYTDPRVAGMTDDQTSAMAKLRSILGMDGTGPSPLPRVIDNIPGAGPAAGSTQDYMDPFLDQVLGPMLREINLSTKNNLQMNDASAHMAGAFGDTGHALERATTMEMGTQAAGDATGRMYSAAYNDAMSRKAGDIDRMMTDRNAMVDMLKQMFNMGSAGQATEQRGLDANFAEFMRKQGFTMDQIAKAAAIIGGLNPGTAVTTPGSPSTASQIMGGLSSAAALFI
ncbi:MAG: hypothetical protein AB7O44_30300 [Hyphomicrobiaceae bacterium]